MKKISPAVSIIALAVGCIASSFSTKMATINERVWFDETQGYQFALYGNTQAIMDYFSMSTQGNTTRVAVGYNESRYGASPSVDPFVYISGSGFGMVYAELKLNASNQLTGASLIINEELIQ